MIQISHTRHVNVQEHPGVNSLAAQAAFLQRIGCVLIARDSEHERTACSQPRSPQPRAPGGLAGAACGLELRRSYGWSLVCSLGPRACVRVRALLCACMQVCVHARLCAALARCWPFASSLVVVIGGGL